MLDSIAKFSDAVANWTGETTNWSRWVGFLMLTTILGVWARLCLVKGEWIDPGATVAVLVFAIFLLLSRKANRSAAVSEPRQASR